MVTLVELGNRHSSRVYVVSYLSFSTCFLISGRVTSFCLRTMLLANFQLLLIRIIIGQGPTMLAVGAGWGCWDNFLISSIDDIVSFFFSPCFWKTARYLNSAV